MKLSVWLMVAFIAAEQPRRGEGSIALSSSSRSSFKSSRSMSRYDKDPRCFSPEGDILQLTYADRAGENGQSLVCLVTAEGSIVLVCPMEQESSRLLDHRSIDKVSRVDDGIWIASAGLLADSRQLVRQARKYCINYRARYGARPSVKSVAHHIGSLQHDASLTGGLRPFGVHLLTAGFEEKFDPAGAPQKIPAVYLSRASGEVTQWNAIAIGRFSGKMIQLLEDTVYADGSFMPGEVAAVDAAVGVLGKVAIRRNMGDVGDGQARAGTNETATAATNQPANSSVISSSSGSGSAMIGTKLVKNGEEEKPNTCNVYTLTTDNQLAIRKVLLVD